MAATLVSVVRRYGLAASVGGAVILAIGFFLESTAFATVARQAIATGGVILVLGVALLVLGTLVGR